MHVETQSNTQIIITLTHIHTPGVQLELNKWCHPPKVLIFSNSVITSCSSPKVLFLLQGAEPPALCSRQKVARPYTEVTMMTLLTSMADKELVHMIAWAKKVPGKNLTRHRNDR